jgi:hypothetical protein
MSEPAHQMTKKQQRNGYIEKNKRDNIQRHSPQILIQANRLKQIGK